MGRGNKVGQLKTKSKPAEQLVEIIVGSVIEAKALPFKEWQALWPSPFTPLAIPVSTGQYPVTQAGFDAASELTQQTWDDQPEFRQTIGRDKFNKISLKAIGDTLLNSPNLLPEDPANDTTFPDSSFYSHLVADYAANLKRFADKERGDIDQHIPCNLFHTDQDVPAFSIGPVDFRPRQKWIDCFVTNPTELNHINDVESGAKSLNELLKDTSSSESYTAYSVISSLQGFEWVATIRMLGHEITQSHTKASIVVGLAIDAIGLRFSVTDARRFTKAGRSHLFREERLATSLDGRFLHGWSLQVPGIGSRPGALTAKMKAERPFFEAVGSILQAYLEGRRKGRAPHLVERWVNALYWVGEARRDPSDFMAVVKYGCAADGLSGAGGDAGEMTKFAKAALNPDGDPTPPGYLTIDEAVTRVYRQGRHKLAHGEEPGLFEDQANTRAIGDNLLVSLIDSVTNEIAKIVSSKDRILEVDEKHAFRALKDRLKHRGKNSSC